MPSAAADYPDVERWGQLVNHVWAVLQSATLEMDEGSAPDERTLSAIKEHRSALVCLLREVKSASPPSVFGAAHERLVKFLEATVAVWTAVENQMDWGLKVLTKLDRRSASAMVEAEEAVQRQGRVLTERAGEFFGQLASVQREKSDVVARLGLSESLVEVIDQLRKA